MLVVICIGERSGRECLKVPTCESCMCRQGVKLDPMSQAHTQQSKIFQLKSKNIQRLSEGGL